MMVAVSVAVVPARVVTDPGNCVVVVMVAVSVAVVPGRVVTEPGS